MKGKKRWNRWVTLAMLVTGLIVAPASLPISTPPQKLEAVIAHYDSEVSSLTTRRASFQTSVSRSDQFGWIALVSLIGFLSLLIYEPKPEDQE